MLFASCLAAIVVVDVLKDLLLARHPRDDLKARNKLEVFERIQIRRVGHRHHQAATRPVHRDHQMPQRVLFGDQVVDGGLDLPGVEVNTRDAVLLGQELCEIARLDVPKLGQRISKALARPPLARLRFLKLRNIDEVFSNEEFAKTLVHGCPYKL